MNVKYVCNDMGVSDSKQLFELIALFDGFKKASFFSIEQSTWKRLS